MNNTKKKIVSAPAKKKTKNIPLAVTMPELKKVEVKTGLACCGGDEKNPCACGRGFGRWFLGLLLVLVGLLYLAKNTGLLPWDINISWGQLWPLLIIIIGLSMINRRSRVSIFFGVVIAAIAILLTLFLISLNLDQKDYLNELNLTNSNNISAIDEEAATTTPVLAPAVKVENIEANQPITSPLTIKGEARSDWFFEGVFPIKLVAENGTELGSTQAKAATDWTVPGNIEFSAVLKYKKSTSTAGILIFSKDNPSGLLQNEAAYAIPVLLK